jgi:hypothetical protein
MDAAWRDRVENLLYDGESVVASVDAGDDRVVVTSHRMLAFVPDAEPRFRQVDRPNVTGVRVDAVGASGRLRRAARFGAWGGGLLAAGLLVSLDATLAGLQSLGGSGAGSGAGDALPLLGALFAALALLDDALRAVGALLLLAAAALVVRYLRSRERAVTIEVSGGDDIDVPGDHHTAAALRDALQSE